MFRVYVDLPEGIVLIGIVTVTELQAKKCTQHKPSTQSPATIWSAFFRSKEPWLQIGSQESGKIYE